MAGVPEIHRHCHRFSSTMSGTAEEDTRHADIVYCPKKLATLSKILRHSRQVVRVERMLCKMSSYPIGTWTVKVGEHQHLHSHLHH
jgi:hypothetical protein